MGLRQARIVQAAGVARGLSGAYGNRNGGISAVSGLLPAFTIAVQDHGRRERFSKAP